MTTESERQRFEAWVTSPPLECEIRRLPKDETKTAWPDQYWDPAVQLAWEAWQQAGAAAGRDVELPIRTLERVIEICRSGLEGKDAIEERNFIIDICRVALAAAAPAQPERAGTADLPQVRAIRRQAFTDAANILRAEQERIGPSYVEGISDTGNLVQVSGHNTLQRMIDRFEALAASGGTE